MYPILFEIGPFSIHALWFFITLGIIFGALFFARLAKRYRLKLDILVQHGLFLILTTVIASRLLYILSHASEYRGISFLFLWDRGFSFWGALLGFFIPLYFLAKQQGESFWRLTDVFVLPILLGVLFGHLGTFFDGVGHGIATDLPWGITFQSAVVKYAVPIHPTQLYAFLYTFVLFFIMWRSSPHWFLKTEGFTTKMTVWVYSLFRFLEEFFRGDDTILLFSFLRVPQVISFLIFTFLAWHFLTIKEPLFLEIVEKGWRFFRRWKKTEVHHS